MKKLIEMLEAFLELGGIKKDVTLLALSGAAVICSLCGVRLAAAAEQCSEHPLGKAIVRGFQKAYADTLPERETFQMVPGQGVCALVGGHTVLAGRPRRFPSPDAGSRAGDFDGQHGDVCCCRRAARFLRWARFFAGP